MANRCEGSPPMNGLLLISLGVAFLVAGPQASTVRAQGIDYASPAIRGKVVAAETGQPLAGVSVLAWWRDTREPDSLLFARTIRAVEVESGRDGTFMVEAWQAKALRAPVSKDSPRLIFFVAGREPAHSSGGPPQSDDRSVEIRMRADGGGAQARARK